MSIPTSALTAAVLAGGEGQRFGGQDKGWLSLAGRPLIEHVCATLVPQASSLLIVANRHRNHYAALGHRVIGDECAGFEGPFAGVIAALAASRSAWLLIAPVDAVRLPPDYGAALAASDGSAPRWLSTADGPQPTCALIPRTLLADARAQFAAGERSLKRWLQRHGVEDVARHDWPARWLSVNMPEQLAALEAEWALA